MLRFDLPWPPGAVSPNSRKHWSVKARAAAKYRRDCWACAVAAGVQKLDCPGLSVSITFYPPGRHRRDLDNLLASMKAGLDGVADATGVDDSKWSFSLSRGDWEKGGRVSVEIAPI